MKKHSCSCFNQRCRQKAAVALAAVLVAAAGTSPADSLWSESASQSMVADKRASRIGDLVTILVQENSSATKDNQTATSKKSGVDTTLETVLYSPKGSAFLTKNGQMPALKWKSNSEFNGGGSINNSEKIAARISVRVADVLPNRNLVLEGQRETSFSGEQQTIILRGVVRVDDILANNTVFSYNVADASIKVISKGTISDSQRQGWLQRVWNKLNPF